MTTALRIFLNSKKCGNITLIEQNFSETGHSQIQEIDCAHSCIEKCFRHKFIFSPVSFMKEFNRIPVGKQTFKILQMTKSDYLDYQDVAQCYKYSVVPFSKIKHLKYCQHSDNVSFKENFNEDFKV